jgi:hypothetical protein
VDSALSHRLLERDVRGSVGSVLQSKAGDVDGGLGLRGRRRLCDFLELEFEGRFLRFCVILCMCPAFVVDGTRECLARSGLGR